MSRILITDDEIDFRDSIVGALRGAGHEVDAAASVDDAVARLHREGYDAVITDLRMPGGSGLSVLREAVRRFPDSILVVLTAYGSMDSAIEALRIGAHDFLLKPVNLSAVVRKVEALLQHRATMDENQLLRQEVERELPTEAMVGRSEPLEKIRQMIAKVAPTDSTVLVMGETGTGKEVIARAIHESSPRKNLPFVAINCGAISETLLESELFGHVRGAFTGADRDKRGLLEMAGGGTLLLDEIGELPLALQPKILRTLENREFFPVGSTTPRKLIARILAATHRNLRTLAESGSFRPDLYYRLGVFELEIPPLRARRDDIAPLVDHLLLRFCRNLNRHRPTLDSEAIAALEQYSWPGNVRELANVLERALILNPGDRLGIDDLPGVVTSAPGSYEDDLVSARAAFEKTHVLRVLAKYKGDAAKAAEALGIARSTLYLKLKPAEQAAS